MTARGALLAVMLLGSLAVIGPFSRPAPVLLWNASGSAPFGLYRVHSANRIDDGDLVVVRPPDALARFLAVRGYLPDGVPLLKHVAGRAGQSVCREGNVVAVDGNEVALAQASDRRGRSLPVWSGCRTLAVNEIILLNLGASDSLDSRYFGPLSTSTIVGLAQPLWIRSGS